MSLYNVSIKSKISDNEDIKSSDKTADCVGSVLSYSNPKYILGEFIINLLSKLGLVSK